MFRAVERGEVEVVARLVKDDRTLLEAEDDEELTPLLLASTMGHAPMVSMLVGKGAEVHAENADENSALHLAAWQVCLTCSRNAASRGCCGRGTASSTLMLLLSLRLTSLSTPHRPSRYLHHPSS